MMRLASDHKKPLATIISEYKDEFPLWQAFDVVIGIPDVHADIATTNFILAKAHFKNDSKLDDFLKRDTGQTFTSENFDVKSYIAMRRKQLSQ